MESAQSISSNGAGKYLLCGSYSNGAAFDGGTTPNAGLKDIFVYHFEEASALIPSVPLNLSLQKQGNDFILTWDPVTTYENGAPLTVSGYNVYYNDLPYSSHDQLIGTCTGNSFTLNASHVAPDLRFFKVKAFLNP